MYEVSGEPCLGFFIFHEHRHGDAFELHLILYSVQLQRSFCIQCYRLLIHKRIAGRLGELIYCEYRLGVFVSF